MHGTFRTSVACCGAPSSVCALRYRCTNLRESGVPPCEEREGTWGRGVGANTCVGRAGYVEAVFHTCWVFTPGGGASTSSSSSALDVSMWARRAEMVRRKGEAKPHEKLQRRSGKLKGGGSVCTTCWNSKMWRKRSYLPY